MMMAFALLANLLAFVVVVLLQWLGLLTINYYAEYLFYMALLLWSVAGLTSVGGFESRYYDSDGSIYAQKLQKIKQMVGKHDFAADKRQQQVDNSSLCLRLFIAGLPSMLICFLL